MTRRRLSALVCIVLLGQYGCNNIPVSRMAVGNSMITTAANLERFQEIPMRAIQLKDVAVMVTYASWEPVEQRAGIHKVKWSWYREGKVVHSCEDKGVFVKSPIRFVCGAPAAGLGVGHFRAELRIDEVLFTTNEFDIVDVAIEKQGAAAEYRAGSTSDKNDDAPSSASKGELLAHCPNAVQVAKEIGFPIAAAEAGIREGSVTLSILLTPSGSMKNIRVIDSTDQTFNQTAIDAATRLQCNGSDLSQEKEISWRLSYRAQ